MIDSLPQLHLSTCLVISVAPGLYCLQVIDSPEVLSVIDSLPHLRPFVSSLYDCRYAAFFQASACLGAALPTVQRVACRRRAVRIADATAAAVAAGVPHWPSTLPRFRPSNHPIPAI